MKDKSNKKISKYSMCGTKVQKKDDVFLKTYKLNTISKKNRSKVSDIIVEYYNSLVLAKIPVSKLIAYDKNLNFQFSYCGDNLEDLLKTNPLNFFKENKLLFNNIIDICAKVYDNKLFFDPHIRNFTVQNGELFYIDTFPPYGNKYLDLLISFNPELENRIIDHFNLYAFNMVPHHFLSDFKKTFPKESKLLSLLVDMMCEKGLIVNLNHSIMNEIIKQENINYFHDPLPIS